MALKLMAQIVRLKNDSNNKFQQQQAAKDRKAHKEALAKKLKERRLPKP